MAHCSSNFCNRSNKKKPSHFSMSVSMKSRPFDALASDRIKSFLVRMRSLQKLSLILRNFVILRSTADAFTSPSYGSPLSGIAAVQDQTCFFGKDGYPADECH